jgi:ribosomal protein L17
VDQGILKGSISFPFGPKYKERKGGYTRLIKLNNPAAGKSKAVVEFVE